MHSAPCPALEQARHRYDGLRDEAKADGPLVLFLVLDELAGSFEEQFLALDARSDEIPVEPLTSSSRCTPAEILAIRRRLADAVQSLDWHRPADRPDNHQQDPKQRPPAIRHGRHNGRRGSAAASSRGRRAGSPHDARHGHEPHHLLRRQRDPRCWPKSALMTR